LATLFEKRWCKIALHSLNARTEGAEVSSTPLIILITVRG